MGQIIGSAAKPKRCNISKLSQLGTPAAGEHYLVSSDNSMNAAGQGNFDCYIVGNGQDPATALPLKHIDSTEFFEMFGGTMEVGAGSTGSAVSFNFPVNLAAGCYELICSKGTVVSTSSAPTLNVTYQDDTTTNFSSYNTFGQKRWIYFASPVKSITYKCQVTTIGTLSLSVKPLRKTEDILKISLDTMSLLPWAFFNGELIASGSSVTPKQDHAKVRCRIATLDKYKFTENVEINVADGYRYYTYLYNDDGTYKSGVTWNTAPSIILAGQMFGILVGTVADSAYVSPDEIAAALTLKTVAASSAINLKIAGADSTGKLQHLAGESGDTYKIKITPWPIANAGHVNNSVLSVSYFRNGTAYDMIKFLHGMVEENGFPNEVFVELPSCDIDDWGVFIRCDTGNYAQMTVEKYVVGDALDVDTTYAGEVIDTKKNKYAITQLGRLNNFGTPSTNNPNAQGMCIYNDRYIVQGSNRVGVGSHIIIVDMTEYTISTITYETLSSGQGFHMNNINFGVKYDASDTLPLVYASECYNTHECKVLRIANDFASFSTIQTISYSEDLGGTYDWVTDVERGKIYALRITNESIIALEFALPSISETLVAFTPSDVIKTHTIENTTGKVLLSQGGTIINGKLWMTFGMDTAAYPANMVVVDLLTDLIVSEVDIAGLGEPEAVCQYKEGVALCVAGGYLTSGTLTNPAYVYMIFNV